MKDLDARSYILLFTTVVTLGIVKVLALLDKGMWQLHEQGKPALGMLQGCESARCIPWHTCNILEKYQKYHNKTR